MNPLQPEQGAPVLHPPCSHEAAALLMLFLIQNPGFCVSLSKGTELEWNELLAGWNLGLSPHTDGFPQDKGQQLPLMCKTEPQVLKMLRRNSLGWALESF